MYEDVSIAAKRVSEALTMYASETSGYEIIFDRSNNMLVLDKTKTR